MTHPFIHPLTDFAALPGTTVTACALALLAPLAAQEPVWGLALGAALLVAYSLLAIFTLLDPILEMADYLASRISRFLTTSSTQEKPHVPLSEKNN